MFDKRVEMYKSGMSCYEIAKTENVSVNSIYPYLKRRGVLMRTNSESHLKTDDLSGILIKYDAGTSCSKLASEYGYTISGISHLLKQNGRTVVVPKAAGNWQFIVDKTSLFYYWLGWMLSDGCIYYKKKDGRNRGVKIWLGLQPGDEHILQFFLTKTGAGKIKDVHSCGYGGGKPKYLSMRRWETQIPREMAEIVSSYGLIPNKTYNFEPTQYLLNMSRHNFMQFLAGFTEGDGATDRRMMKSRKHAYQMDRIRWTGSPKLMKFIKDKLVEFGYKDRKILAIPESFACEFGIAGLEATKLINELKQSEFCLLDRKWNRFN